MGGASPHSRRLCSRHASATDSAVAVCAGLGCAGCLTQALPGCLRRGSRLAILTGCMAWGGVWTQCSSHLVRHPAAVVHPAAVRVRGTDGGRRVYCGLEDSRPAQNRCSQEIYAASQSSSAGVTPEAAFPPLPAL